jgi:hypothetical protein
VEFAYYFHYCKNLKFEDRPDYSTLKSLFFDLLMQDYSINTEFVFDWFLEPEEEKEERDRHNMKTKNAFNANQLNASEEQNNIIDLTPMDIGSESNRKTPEPKSPRKGDYNQYNNTKTAEFNNSPQKNTVHQEAKTGTLHSIPKHRTRSFSESGSSDDSDLDDTLRMKAEDEVKKSKISINPLANSYDKRDESRFNIIKSSSEDDSKKNQGNNYIDNFNIDDDIQFKNNKDVLDSSRRKNDVVHDGDIVLNVKKK